MPKAPNIKVTPPGPLTQKIVTEDSQYICKTSKTSPVAIKSARNALVEDVDGNTLIDFYAGIGVLNIGHSHPNVVRAIHEQVDKFTHFAGTDFYYEMQNRLAKTLDEIAPGKYPHKVFFCNSGAESVEASMKIARWRTKRKTYVGFLGAFHGRTMGVLAVTASKAIQREGFFPMMPGVYHIPYANCYHCPYKLTYPECDLWCAKILEELYFETLIPPSELAAVVLEPIQGEGGYLVPPDGWLQEMRKITKRHDVLLVADEVQSGIGRTGKMWACEHWGVVPDIVASAKGLGSGMPIGASIFPAEFDFDRQGRHSNTYGGNPVACAAALATIETIQKENLLDRATKEGAYLRKRLDELQARYPIIGDTRGVGMMLAQEFVADRKTKKPAKKSRDEIVEKAYKRGLLLLPCGTSAIRYIPPLTTEREYLDAAVEVLDSCIKEIKTPA